MTEIALDTTQMAGRSGEKSCLLQYRKVGDVSADLTDINIEATSAHVMLCLNMDIGLRERPVS